MYVCHRGRTQYGTGRRWGPATRIGFAGNAGRARGHAGWIRRRAGGRVLGRGELRRWLAAESRQRHPRARIRHRARMRDRSRQNPRASTSAVPPNRAATSSTAGARDVPPGTDAGPKSARDPSPSPTATWRALVAVSRSISVCIALCASAIPLSPEAWPAHGRRRGGSDRPTPPTGRCSRAAALRATRWRGRPRRDDRSGPEGSVEAIGNAIARRIPPGSSCMGTAQPGRTSSPPRPAGRLLAWQRHSEGNSASSPGSPFDEPGFGSQPNGGTGGLNYSEKSQYDVACYHVNNKP